MQRMRIGGALLAIVLSLRSVYKYLVKMEKMREENIIITFMVSIGSETSTVCKRNKISLRLTKREYLPCH